MRIEKMLLNSVISVRAYNVCKKNHLSNASEILDYYREKGSFINLRHCGNKSDMELKELCEELEQAENANVSEPKIFDLNFFQKLDQSEVTTINRYIENETRILSQRSSNAISKYLKYQVCLQSLCENIYGNSDFQVMNLHNIGKGTIDELTAYLENIESFIHSVYRKKN